MERMRHSQLELFSGLKDYNQAKTGVSEPFWRYLWNYEKIIFIIIGFIITGIVFFTLGVEKGKESAALKLNAQFNMATKTQISRPVQTPIKPVQTPIKEEVSPVKLQQPSSSQNYTIQIASYQTKTYAQKEAESLKKRGFASLVLPKGTYTIVCVGNFADEKTARPLLSKLKKRYQDCFIRRL
jgi:hypothetical protein